MEVRKESTCTYLLCSSLFHVPCNGSGDLVMSVYLTGMDRDNKILDFPPHRPGCRYGIHHLGTEETWGGGGGGGGIVRVYFFHGI